MARHICSNLQAKSSPEKKRKPFIHLLKKRNFCHRAGGQKEREKNKWNISVLFCEKNIMVKQKTF